MAGRESEEEAPFVAHVRDLLHDWGPVGARRMFGGVGLYRGGVMFGLIFDDTLYFKVDDENRADYEKEGMPPFLYDRQAKTVALSYYAVPPALLDDGEALASWAEKALAAARRRAAPDRRRGRGRRLR